MKEFQRAEAIGRSLTVTAEVSGQVEALRAFAQTAGCEQAVIELNKALTHIANAGTGLALDLQRLSGDAANAAFNALHHRIAS